MYLNKYILEGFHPFEYSYMRLFESGSVAARKYFKEIEIIIQVIKENLNKREDYYFDINETEDCNIDIADVVNFHISYESSNSDAEYYADSAVFDDEHLKMKSIDIVIFLKDELNESKLREDIVHELNHAYEDKCMRCDEQKTSLLDSYDLSQVDIQLVSQFFSAGDEIANLLYILFIKTETNAFVSQIYSDLISLNKERSLIRSNWYIDIQDTETFKSYEKLRSYYENNILHHKLNIAKVMKYFPDVLSKRLSIHKNNRQSFDKRFEMWFRRTLKSKLKIVWIKICKAIDQFYTDQYNDVFNVDYDDILKKAQSTKRELYETSLLNQYTVNCYDDYFVYETKSFEIIKAE